MTAGTHQMKLALPIEHVWSFISDVNNWAYCIDGYIHHQMINPKQSNWKIKGDLGVVQRTVQIKVHIMEWKKPNKIMFRFSGLQGKINGNGYFKAFDNNQTTEVCTHISIQLNGLKGSLIRPVLKPLMPKIVKRLTERVAKEITQKHPIPLA